MNNGAGDDTLIGATILKASRYRYRVLGFLSVLSVITYLDRVCISVAGPRMQDDLGISVEGWGWVVGVFAIAYGAFEIPSGYLGDRFGPRRVLTCIVIWWSTFTLLTGMVSALPLLLLTRFLFGVGEAGAYPNTAAAISRWFPATERGRAFGMVWMASQSGAALSPLLVVPIQIRYGWRASFYAFALLGVVWSMVWFWWYRDDPSEKRNTSRRELKEIDAQPHVSGQRLPLRLIIRSRNLWAILLMAFAYCYAMYFFIAWLHTWLVKGRGFSERQLLFSTLPFAIGAVANAFGGLSGDVLVRRYGLKWGRRMAGAVGLGVAAAAVVAAVLSTNKLVSLGFLTLGYAGIAFQQPIAWAVCLDVGKSHAGAVSGAMNTAAQAGSFLLAISFGYIAGVTGSFDLPLVSVALALIAGAFFWLRIDPTEALVTSNSPCGNSVVE